MIKFHQVTHRQVPFKNPNHEFNIKLQNKIALLLNLPAISFQLGLNKISSKSHQVRLNIPTENSEREEWHDRKRGGKYQGPSNGTARVDEVSRHGRTENSD